MDLFIHLLLTHFLADYPFQSGALLRLKFRTYWGVLLHCLIHLASMVALLFPLLHNSRVWVGIAVIFFTHNLIDQIKVTLDKKYPRYHLAFYAGDQIAHWLVVGGVTLAVGPVLPQGWGADLYQNTLLFVYLLALVISTYFYDVTRYFLNLPKRGKKPYRRDYPRMLKNALIVSVSFFLYTLLA